MEGSEINVTENVNVTSEFVNPDADVSNNKKISVIDTLEPSIDIKIEDVYNESSNTEKYISAIFDEHVESSKE